MTSYARRAGAELLRTIALALDPGAEPSRALMFAKNARGVPQLFVQSPDGVRQISGIECNIWDRPVAPSIYDDEFDTTTLDAAWTTTGGVWTKGSINPYAAFAAGDIRYEMHTERRPSWIMVQKPSGGFATIYKLIAPAGDFFVYARTSFTTRSAATVGNEDAFILSISNNPITNNERVNIALTAPIAGNSLIMQFYRTNGGVNTQIGSTMNDFAGTMGMPSIDTIGITRRGTTYDGWGFGASGHALWLGSTVHAGVAPASIELTFVGTVSTNPGNRIVGCDFFRYRDGSLYLP